MMYDNNNNTLHYYHFIVQIYNSNTNIIYNYIYKSNSAV